jgi:basic amino acid/polyamine antiporter, APA family
LSGWVSFLIGEGDRPQKRMPRAILLGTGLVVALYLALNTAYALALSAADVRASASGPENVNSVAPIAQIAADRLYGHRIDNPLSVAIGLTLLALVSAYILTGPRVAFAMARAGQFPEIAGRLSVRGTPAIATALQVAWSLALLWTASFERILLYSGALAPAIYRVRVALPYLKAKWTWRSERPVWTKG